MTLERLLIDAVRSASDGDGPVALQISGGLDSAAIQAVGKFDRLYCCTFEFDGVSNMAIAQLAALGQPVTPVGFTRHEMLNVLPEVKRLTDGKGTWSQVCQWFLCRRAAEDGAKIMITGEGADELFGGYARYKILHHLDKAFDDPKLEAYRGIVEHMMGGKRAVLVNMLSRNMARHEAERCVPAGEPASLVKAMASVEFNSCLPALLEYGAAMAGAHGLACRFPFMDPAIVEYAAKLEPGQMVTDDCTKAALRRAAERLGVHPRIIHEVTKRGLFIPPSWAPQGSPKWSRGWFERLMEQA